MKYLKVFFDYVKQLHLTPEQRKLESSANLTQLEINLRELQQTHTKIML